MKGKSIIKGNLPISKEIEYKKISEERLDWAASFEKKIINPDEEGYVSDNLVEEVKKANFQEFNTTIFNIGTGQGKTTASLKLADEYIEIGCKVIFIAPYKKLVDKYLNDFDKTHHTVFNYQDLESKQEKSFIEQALDCDVFLMSMNFFLQDPGQDFVKQKYSKSNFIFKLIGKFINKKTKVVLFIDEFHANVSNFDNYYSANILKWLSIVKKTFIISATFTEESLSQIQKISLLNRYRVVVYESPRIKLKSQAELSLLLLDKYKSGKETHVFNHLLELVKLKKGEGKKINIIVAYKSLTNSLFKGESELSRQLLKELGKLNFLTSESDDTFDNELHNVGTTFNTGIDIVDENSVLIVILPPVRTVKGGIFTNGYISIIQTIARQRNGGEIFVYGKSRCFN